MRDRVWNFAAAFINLRLMWNAKILRNWNLWARRNILKSYWLLRSALKTRLFGFYRNTSNQKFKMPWIISIKKKFLNYWKYHYFRIMLIKLSLAPYIQPKFSIKFFDDFLVVVESYQMWNHWLGRSTELPYEGSWNYTKTIHEKPLLFPSDEIYYISQILFWRWNI